MGSPDDRRAGALLLRESARRLSRPTELFIPQFEPNWADSRLNSVRWPGWPLQMQPGGSQEPEAALPNETPVAIAALLSHEEAYFSD